MSGNASRRKDISNWVFNERKDILQVGITCQLQAWGEESAEFIESDE